MSFLLIFFIVGASKKPTRRADRLEYFSVNGFVLKNSETVVEEYFLHTVCVQKILQLLGYGNESVGVCVFGISALAVKILRAGTAIVVAVRALDESTRGIISCGAGITGKLRGVFVTRALGNAIIAAAVYITEIG